MYSPLTDGPGFGTEAQKIADMTSSGLRLPPQSVTQHVFQIHNYKRPTFCAHCGNLLVGVVKQGLRCKRCEVDVHEKCQEDLQKPCIEVIVGQHNFREKSYKQLTYCDHCEKLLVGVVNQGLKCTECGMNVHEKCQVKVHGVACEKTPRKKSLPKDGGLASPQLQRMAGSRRTARRAVKKATERTPLKEDSTPTGRDMSTIFESMPEKAGSSLMASSLPGSPSRVRKEQRSHSLTNTTQALNKQVEEVMTVMKDTAVKLEQRGEKLEDLQDNAEKLERNADVFKKKAEDIKRKFWYQNQKLWIGVGIAVAILIIVIVIIVVVETQMSKSS
ncbi:unnamed protein product [Clavelina lepadiformis]|uniref:Phorbol-ester/DAG-type domain-containing protein n=1 Tax=Clavelina lepadiformis TaxID=159417 RepID=A0ABP0GQD8_CLALP